MGVSTCLRTPLLTARRRRSGDAICALWCGSVKHSFTAAEYQNARVLCEHTQCGVVVVPPPLLMFVRQFALYIYIVYMLYVVYAREKYARQAHLRVLFARAQRTYSIHILCVSTADL